MRKSALKISLFLIGLSALLLLPPACEKVDQDPEYRFQVNIKTFEDSIPVPNCRVQVFVPTQLSKVRMTGFTDEKGSVEFEYDFEAILLIRATRGNAKSPTHIGCNDVRLEPNEKVQKTVYIRPYDDDIPGC